MKETAYWLQKIVQLLHDPPGKPYFFRRGSGGHNQLATEILKILMAEDKPARRRLADLLATGADRPVVNLPWGIKGNTGIQYFHKDPTITHPLEYFPLKLNHPGNSEQITSDKIDDILNDQLEAAAISAVKQIPSTTEDCKKSWLMLWRRMREDIVDRGRKYSDDSFLWQLMPADSRCPDHSIWEHNRLASALAFVPAKLGKGQEQEPEFPWLFSFALRPVQEFLNQARKSQDLWTGSMLLSELCWAAIRKIIEHYGPDAIIYPDLRGNPRADLWLETHEKDAMPAGWPGISTRAAVIPHTFVAILPRGGKDHLLALEDIGAMACAGVNEKWAELTGNVQKWMATVQDKQGSSWQSLWNHAQSSCPVEPTWVAQPWVVLEKQNEYFYPDRAMPAQDNVPQPDDNDRRVLLRRHHQLGQWMNSTTWKEYEYALSVFARTNENYLLASGFSYGPNHHKLKIRHGLRRRITNLPVPTPENISFEKCSLCHQRAALGNEDFDKEQNSHIESIRQQVRSFWKNREFNPDGSGSERLCAVCATKRFIVRADSVAKTDNKANSFNSIWIGTKKNLADVRDSKSGTVRTPFPSTVQIAAQDFLVDLAGHADKLHNEMAAIISLHRQLELPFTSFPASLPMFAGSVTQEQLDNDFFKLDPQLSLFPEMVESKVSYADNDTRELWQKLHNHVEQFRKAVNKLNIQPPATQLAVITMDGDKMGDLLLGRQGRIKTRWQDIIHPDFVDKIRERFDDKGWPELLNHQRLGGPSLQAFISRALADFSHTIVPWVVEQEFGGRLIYSGGDDLLALAPAHHALEMADRLQKLFSSAWVIDTQPEIRPWEWLDNPSASKWNPKQAKNRFQLVIKANPSGKDQHNPHKLPDRGRLMPMLGKSGSLSAGIMYGHFKTSLGLLRQSSHDLLEQWAKEKGGRNAAGLGHFSRSGVKTMFAAKWDSDGDLAVHLTNIIDGFRKKNKKNEKKREEKYKLPGSLPYKLMEYHKKLDPILLTENDEQPDKAREGLLQGMLDKALDGKKIDDDLQRAVLAVWQAGFKLGSRPSAQYCLQKDGAEDHHLDGLLLCRYLATRT